MPAAEIYRPSDHERLRQGEILSGVAQYRLEPEAIEAEEKEFLESIHPTAIILTQDCDLESDYKLRKEEGEPGKFLPNVLFCEMMEADLAAKVGPQRLASDIRRQVRNNKNERYQYLRAVTKDQDAREKGLPDSILDFKRYFTLTTEEIYRRLSSAEGKMHRRCRLTTPFAEHVSMRFFYFQMRIPLPEEHLLR